MPRKKAPQRHRSMGLLCIICGRELTDPEDVFRFDGLCFKCFGAIYHFEKVFNDANLRASACQFVLYRKRRR